MSGRKSRLPKYQIITAASMGADITSTVTNIQGLDNIGLQLVWTGSPVGDFKIQISIDYAQDNQGNVTNAGNWNDITFSTAPATSAGSPIYVDITGISSPWIRVFYDRTSGTGTLNAYIAAKML